MRNQHVSTLRLRLRCQHFSKSSESLAMSVEPDCYLK